MPLFPGWQGTQPISRRSMMAREIRNGCTPPDYKRGTDRCAFGLFAHCIASVSSSAIREVGVDSREICDIDLQGPQPQIDGRQTVERVRELNSPGPES